MRQGTVALCIVGAICVAGARMPEEFFEAVAHRLPPEQPVGPRRGESPNQPPDFHYDGETENDDPRDDGVRCDCSDCF